MRRTNTVLCPKRRHCIAWVEIVRGHVDDSPLDPTPRSVSQSEIWPRWRPASALLRASLARAAVHPVPLNRETLEPTAAALTTLSEVDAHWRANAADGVGVRGGVQANGHTSYGVRGTLGALRDCLADVGTEPDELSTSMATRSPSGAHIERSRPTPGSAGTRPRRRLVAALSHPAQT